MKLYFNDQRKNSNLGVIHKWRQNIKGSNMFLFRTNPSNSKGDI